MTQPAHKHCAGCFCFSKPELKEETWLKEGLFVIFQEKKTEGRGEKYFGLKIEKFFSCPLCCFSLKHEGGFEEISREWLIAFCELAPGRSFFIKASRSQVLSFSDTLSTCPCWTLPNQYGCNFLDHPLQRESICLIETSRGGILFSSSSSSSLVRG